MIPLDLHGLRIKFSCDDPEIEELLGSYYHFLLDPNPDSPAPIGDLDFVAETGCAFKGSLIGYHRVSGDALHIEFGSRVMSAEIHPRDGPVRVMAASLAGLSTEVVLECIFFQPLKFVVKRWGFFFMHAACMALDPTRGALFLGPPRAGKSSFVLALLREGYAYVAEDAPLVRRRDGELRSYAFHEDLAIRPESLPRFPEAFPWCRGSTAPYVKYRVPIENLYPGRVLDTCRPRLLFFLEWTADDGMAISEMPRDQALTDLLRDELDVYRQGPATAFTREHMQVLSDIVAHTHPYRLRYSNGALPEAVQEVTRLLQSE